MSRLTQPRGRALQAQPEPAPAPYRDRWEHLHDRLQLLDARLAALAETARRERPATDAPPSAAWGHGMFVSDDEIDALLSSRADGRTALEVKNAIDRKVEASIGAGIDLPLFRLAQTFRLSAWEEEVLVLCLAPELDRRYERAYGYLHDDINRRQPSIELALALLGDDLATRAAGRAALGEQATLVRAGLVLAAHENQDDGASARLSQSIRLDSRISDVLLGRTEMPSRQWLRRMDTLGGEPTGLAARLLAIARQTLTSSSGSEKLLVSLHGGSQAAAIDLAAEVCGPLEAPLLLLDLPLLVAAGAPFEKAVREAVREALLQPCALLVDCGDGLGQTPAESEFRMAQLIDALTDFAWLAFVVARYPINAQRGAQQPWLSVELPAPDLAARATAWYAALTAHGITVDHAEADSLAGRYRLAISQLESVVASARLRAKLRGDEASPLVSDVEAACRDAGASALIGLANRISPRFGWHDIVLAKDSMRQLEEIVAAVKSRRRVLSDWGFGARLSRGKGLSALFSGAPGTGKTMAAEIIAGELGLDLYTVDLATVVSKYIGETEKNLSRIFDAAESTSSLLFFDEADALFGKRSEVTEAHDRYANIEISYLLQRIDTYEGLVILSTNLKRNLDEAFLRRLNFVVDLPFPDVDERRRIWRRIPPSEAPIADDVNWEFLAEKFALSGGNIKGAFLHATYQAAARNDAVGMGDLVLGLRRELDKMGKVTSAADFGPYWRLLDGAQR